MEISSCNCQFPLGYIYTDYKMRAWCSMIHVPKETYITEGGGGGGGGGHPPDLERKFFSPLIMLRTQQLQLAIMDLPIHFVKRR